MPFEAVQGAAPEVQIEAEDGSFALGTCWRDRAAVLVFLRHFG